MPRRPVDPQHRKILLPQLNRRSRGRFMHLRKYLRSTRVLPAALPEGCDLYLFGDAATPLVLLGQTLLAVRDACGRRAPAGLPEPTY